MIDFLYYDTETCGLHGLPVLIQYALNDGEIVLFEPWKRPIQDTLELIQWMMTKINVGFNLVFDHFHLSKLYTLFCLIGDNCGNIVPETLSEEYIAGLEEQARFVDLCLRPVGAIDLMLMAFKGPYQSLMERKDIRVKQIANLVRAKLEKEIALGDMYFANKANMDDPHWSIVGHKHDGEDQVAWRDIKLGFAPSGSLKSLAKELLGEKDVFKFKDIMPARMPKDKKLGYAPFAKAHMGTERDSWYGYLKEHIEFWHTDKRGRKYAYKDVDFTRRLHQHEHFRESDPQDRDSLLACHVASVRWRGFDLDIKALTALREKYQKVQESVPQAGNACMQYLSEGLGEIRSQIILQRGTGKPVMQKLIAEWGKDTPGVDRMIKVMKARQAKKRVEMVDKLLWAGRWHPSYKIMGTLSNRMSGRDGLNPQGFPRQPEFRNCFLMTQDPNEDYQYGDFDSFEIAIAASAYNDDQLNEDLRSGRKFHGLFGAALFNKTYEQILADKAMYSDAKIAGFSNLYGGTWMTMVINQGIDEETAKSGEQRFLKKYTSVAEARKDAMDKFCSMRQPDGVGTNIEWHDPADYIESLLGFRRYYTLENQIVKALYDLSSNAPDEWTAYDVCKACNGEGVVSVTMGGVCNRCKGSGCTIATCQRRDRRQTLKGAAQSALFLAAFQVQSANMRSAANHVIQSTGGEICKELQVRIAKLQPVGIHKFLVRTANVHDEVETVVHKSVKHRPAEIVQDILNDYRDLIEFIGMGWVTGMKYWKDEEIDCVCGDCHGTRFEGTIEEIEGEKKYTECPMVGVL
jgi:hypothetical protein